MEQEAIHFKKSEEISAIANQLFAQEKEHILNIVPSADVEHVGSSAIPEALTIGDVDIQVRVDQEHFEQAAEGLKTLYEINHPELWVEQFALFKLEKKVKLPMSVVVTVINSKYDEFYRIRDLFKNNSDLLKKYNDLKRSYEGKPLQEYKKAKKDFFGPNGESYLLANMK